MITEMYISMFFLGVLIGIIDAWNEKIMFFIWIAGIIFSIMTKASGFDLASEGMSNWHWFGIIPAGCLGMYIGKSAYNNIFKKSEAK